MGAKWVEVSAAQHLSILKFYGKKIKEGNKLKAIKKIGNKEKRIVNDELHKIAKDIIDEAEKHNVT